MFLTGWRQKSGIEANGSLSVDLQKDSLRDADVSEELIYQDLAGKKEERPDLRRAQIL